MVTVNIQSVFKEIGCAQEQESEAEARGTRRMKEKKFLR